MSHFGIIFGSVQPINLNKMKNILIVLLLVISTSVFAQKIKSGDVPKQVKEKFETLYPGTTAKWEKEKGNYEAAFKKDAKSMTVVINPSGNLIETETAIKVSELPKNVSDYVVKNFPHSPITEAATIIDTKGVLKYEVEIKGKDHLFDKDGNPLN